MSDNPKAFPLPHFEQNGKVFYQDGMTLRDWFAGQALAGYCAADGTDGLAHNSVARQSYALADAMLETRKAKP